jgi:gas vesicle protein
VHINDKEKRTNKYYTIAHTIANEQIKDDTAQIKDASKRFINNISNLIKSIDSDGKVLYTQAQTGGAIKNHQTSLQEETYRKKYLKYKYKYLKFK